MIGKSIVTYMLDTDMFKDKYFFTESFAAMPVGRRRKVESMRHESGRFLSLGASVLLHYGLARLDLPNADLAIRYGQYGKP